MDEDERLRQFNAEHDRIYTSPPIEKLINQGTPGKGPEGLSPDQQAVLRQVEANSINQPTAPTPTQTYVPPAASQPLTGDICPQCNTIHPPLKQGQKCPNASVNLPSIKDEEIGEFLVSMRNIIISQVEKNQVKDVKKLFQQAIVVLAKFLEEYQEELKDESNPTESP